MKKQLLRYAFLTSVASLTLGAATVAGATSGTIDTTGPDSHNDINYSSTSTVSLDNNNNASATNNNPQSTVSGEAEVEHNTTGGNATSGAASNDSSLEVSYSVSNNGMSWGNMGSDSFGDDATIKNTGPDSENTIGFVHTMSVNVSNNNNLTVTNNNSQTAVSGEAEVEGNTTGGNATSGDASNTSNTTIMMDIMN